jgi:hypothetical protein
MFRHDSTRVIIFCSSNSNKSLHRLNQFL